MAVSGSFFHCDDLHFIFVTTSKDLSVQYSCKIWNIFYVFNKAAAAEYEFDLKTAETYLTLLC